MPSQGRGGGVGMCVCTLTLGWDSDRRVDPPWWILANSDGGASQCVGHIRKNSGERTVRRKSWKMSGGKKKI